MFRESTVSNEKDKTAFYCTVSAFNCAARHTMMLRDQNTSNYSFSLSSSLSIEKWLIISLLFTSTACNPPLSGSKGACWDFTEGACDLSETNIIDHDRFVDSPEECQVTEIKPSNFAAKKLTNFNKVFVTMQAMCRDIPSCNWFTHFTTQCYLLADCGDTAQ